MAVVELANSEAVVTGYVSYFRFVGTAAIYYAIHFVVSGGE